MGFGKVAPALLMDNASAQSTPAAAPSTTRRIPAIRFIASLQRWILPMYLEVWRLTVTELLQFGESCLNRLRPNYESCVSLPVPGLYLYKNQWAMGAEG